MACQPRCQHGDRAVYLPACREAVLTHSRWRRNLLLDFARLERQGPFLLPNIIKVENLVKKFGDFVAVNDVSLEVGSGEIFALLGPNGAGKTTTMKMLTTLLRPTGGTLLVDGMDPASDATEVRKRFGIVFQDPSLDGEMTAAENMELHGIFYHVPRKLRLHRTELLLKIFELWDRRKEQ